MLILEHINRIVSRTLSYHVFGTAQAVAIPPRESNLYGALLDFKICRNLIIALFYKAIGRNIQPAVSLQGKENFLSVRCAASYCSFCFKSAYSEAKVTRYQPS